MGVNDGVSIGSDLNNNNQNCNGLFASYGDIYCSGDLYLSDNKSDKYVYVNNQCTIEFNSINMNNKVLIGDYEKYK